MAEAQLAPSFGLRHRLALALEASGLSRDDIAAELAVHRNTISNYLSGRTIPTRAVLIAWHLRTGVSLEWLETGFMSTVTDGELHSNSASHAPFPAAA